MGKSKNYLEDGLISDEKLKNSFYNFLYEKHFDWAIVIAAFIAPLPYLSSKYYWILILKVIIFSLLVYFIFRYIINWKMLQLYYKKYEKANELVESFIDKEKLKNKEFDKYYEFNKEFILELRSLANSFQENKDNSTFQDFIQNHPEKVKPLVDLLNEDLSLTKTFFGVTMNMLINIIHLREIPRNELKNYRRFLIIILLLFLFFLIYTIEMSFI
ncbi:hypothetical protein [Rosettibacter firmus]|uniref:hypothetical protein n=1 Tax=Rosettibacter firmus TaxID=3111522 RepID=UPI00336BF734